MSNFEAFVTGFLGRGAEKVRERKDKAENYFDQAIERARTVGADNLRQRTDNYQAMLSVANNLVSQAGMPEDLVRTIANEGPAALEEAYQVYATTADAIANGADISLGEDFWRDAYGFATEMTSGSDMSLEDFLRQVNGLYGSNLAATEQEGGDPFGAFIASGLGLNAMERAQERLGEYDMGGGYSAADLNAMEARPSTTSPLGETGFGGLNRQYLAEQVAQESVWNPDPEERLRIVERFDEAVDAETQQLFDEYSAGVSTSGETANRTLESFREEAAQNVAIAYATTFASSGVDFASAFPELSIYLPPEYFEDEEGDDVVAPPPDSAIITTPLPPPSQLSPDDPIADIIIGEGAPPPPASVPPEAPELTSFDTSEVNLILEDGTTAKYVGTTPSGKIRYQMEDGSYVEGTREEIEEIIQSGGAQRMPSLGLGGMDTSVPLNEE